MLMSQKKNNETYKNYLAIEIPENYIMFKQQSI